MNTWILTSIILSNSILFIVTSINMLKLWNIKDKQKKELNYLIFYFLGTFVVMQLLFFSLKISMIDVNSKIDLIVSISTLFVAIILVCKDRVYKDRSKINIINNIISVILTITIILTIMAIIISYL